MMMRRDASGSGVPGNGLRPYPWRTRARAFSPNGDVEVTWIRRTRIDGDSWSAADVPLGEDSLLFSIRYFHPLGSDPRSDGSGRKLSLCGGRQTGGRAVFAVRICVAQVSQSYGPGPERELLAG